MDNGQESDTGGGNVPQSNDPASPGMSSDIKWVAGTIIATGIGVAVVVGALVGHQVSDVRNELRNHENRVNESNDNVIRELQTLLHPMRTDFREGMHAVEDELKEIKQRLDDLKD